MNNQVVEIDNDGVVLEGDNAVEQVSMVTGLAKAEIDQQIATARSFPRKVPSVVREITSMATLSEGAAAEMNYSLPRGGKSLTGPTIRMAELIVSSWGNCRVGARVVHVDRVEKYLEAEGVFHDLQSNASTTARVRRKISNRDGILFNDDMITVAGNAACSIAKRNAVLAGVPKAAWMPGYEAAMKVIKGDAVTLSERRGKALTMLGAFGVTPDMIFGALGVDDIQEVTLEHMPTLIGWHTGLKSEEATVEGLFGRPGGEDPNAKPKKEKKSAKGVKSKLEDAVKETDDEGSEKGKKAEGDDKKSKPDPDDEKTDDSKAEQEGQSEQGFTEDQILEAKERGEIAFTKGRSRSALPSSVKGHSELETAFHSGFDEAKAEAETAKSE